MKLKHWNSNYIHGKFVPSENSFWAENPSDEVLYGAFPVSNAAEVDSAVAAARLAFANWRKVSRVKRAEYFDHLATLVSIRSNEIAEAISEETGKNLNEALAEVVEALHMCQYVAGMGRQPYGEVYASELAEKDSYVIRKPKGVVAVISPWNFPFAIGSFWCACPAILEGNTVVHKPSELTPGVNALAAELFHAAGFPAGVFNVVHGDGETGSHLVHADVDAILFTGSADVGQKIRRHCADSFHKTCSIECGSKSATMVFADGDLGLALDATIASAFKLSGQRCVSSSRILIERSIYATFKQEFSDRVKKIRVGPPDAMPTPMFGPLISKEQKERVIAFNRLAFNDPDVEVIHHESVPSVLSQGHFLMPFVYGCEWTNKSFLKQEVFGPHVALIPFNDLDDAIRIYNDTDYGLALGVITDDYRKHRRIVQDCTAGMIYLNGGSIAAESHLNFSSWKKSGWGASAAGTWKAVTHTTAVTVNYEQGKLSFPQGMEA